VQAVHVLWQTVSLLLSIILKSSVCLQGKGKASAVDKGKSAASGKGKGTVQEEAATASDRSDTKSDHLTGL